MENIPVPHNNVTNMINVIYIFHSGIKTKYNDYSQITKNLSLQINIYGNNLFLSNLNKHHPNQVYLGVENADYEWTRAILNTAN